MAGKKRGAKDEPTLALIPPEALPGAVDTTPAMVVVAPPTQIERVAALARARDEGDREATIRTFCECAAMVMLYEAPKDPRAPEVPTESERLLAELRRRFGANDPRVLHHLQARGLS